MLPDTRFELRRRWLVELVRVSGATDPKQGQTILPQLAEPATNPEIEQASDYSLCTRAVVMIVILVTIAVVLVLILVKFIVMPRCCTKRSVGVESKDVEANDDDTLDTCRHGGENSSVVVDCGGWLTTEEMKKDSFF